MTDADRWLHRGVSLANDAEEQLKDIRSSLPLSSCCGAQLFVLQLYHILYLMPSRLVTRPRCHVLAEQHGWLILEQSG
jgi:hypothetical protein